MSLTVTPRGRSTSARQPGPSLMIGAGKLMPSPPLASAWLIPARPSAPSARMTCSLVSLATLCGTTARSSSGRSADEPRQASSPTAARTASVRAQAGTSASPATATATSSAAVASRIVRQRIRSSRCPDSFMYISGSLLCTALDRNGTPSASPAHRDTSPSTRHEPTGTRRATRATYFGARTA